LIRRAAPPATGGELLDPLQICARRFEVGVPELPLDDVHRNAFAGQLESVRVAELMWCEPASHTRVGHHSVEVLEARSSIPACRLFALTVADQQRPTDHIRRLPLRTSDRRKRKPHVRAQIQAHVPSMVNGEVGPAAIRASDDTVGPYAELLRRQPGQR
jgi:hypothetical protein